MGSLLLPVIALVSCVLSSFMPTESRAAITFPTPAVLLIEEIMPDCTIACTCDAPIFSGDHFHKFTQPCYSGSWRESLSYLAITTISASEVQNLKHAEKLA